MPFAKVNGIDLYYEEHGQGAPVIFVHGGGGNHLSWWQQVPAFWKRYRVVTLDLRGFGVSHNTSNQSGADILASDLLGLMDHLEIKKAYLVAQSLGGWAIWGAAEKAPERVIAMVMADTPGGVPVAATAQWAKETRERGGSVLDRAIAPRLAIERPDLAFLYRQIQGLNDRRPMDTKAPSPLADAHARPPRPLTKWPIPTLFIVGEEDAITTAPFIETVAKAVPGARLIKFAGAGHSVYFEKAPEFNKAVLEFFGEVERGG